MDAADGVHPFALRQRVCVSDIVDTAGGARLRGGDDRVRDVADVAARGAPGCNPRVEIDRPSGVHALAIDRYAAALVIARAVDHRQPQDRRFQLCVEHRALDGDLVVVPVDRVLRRPLPAWKARLTERCVLANGRLLQRARLRAREAAPCAVDVHAAQHDDAAGDARERLQQARCVGLGVCHAIHDDLGSERAQLTPVLRDALAIAEHARDASWKVSLALAAVEACDVVTCSSEGEHHRVADEAGSTDDEHLHGAQSIVCAMHVEPLARRPFLGLHVKAGVIAEVLVGSAAEEARVCAGDRLVAIDGEEVMDAIHLLGIARARRAGENVVFRVERDGNTLDLVGRAPPLPIEAGATLAEIAVQGHRLRTLSNGDRSRDAVLYVQGIRPRSVEHPLDPNDPLRHLVDGLVQAGLHVMRIERAGVGDSEGPSCATTGLDLELDTYLAAIDRLLEHGQRVFLFGQSLGAMTAPLLALERRVAGLFVFGSSAERWVECVASTTRRQLLMRGKSEEEAKLEAARWSEMLRLVCREGWTPDLVFERRPELRVLRSVDCMGETYQGRHVSLFQQLDAVDLFSVWRELGQTGVPVVVGRGEYDWICSREEGQDIARAVGDSARYLELPHTGHDWLWYETFEKSREWGEGRWEGAIVRAVQTFTSPQPSGNTQP